MNSVEKVNAALDHIANADLSAIGVNMVMASTLRAALPLVRASFIPTDPAELDDMLARCAQFCIGLRSDDAPALEAGALTTPELEAPHAQAPALEG